jgi:hypothetical protein
MFGIVWRSFPENEFRFTPDRVSLADAKIPGPENSFASILRCSTDVILMLSINPGSINTYVNTWFLNNPG